ncbi:hypothetical protein [Rhodococcus sp. BE178]|uniref:hypothetical protein n=1 Tax=Rhodococcus sp. BE178 TaxID=2817737 RepID=UPI003D199AD3
MTRTDGPDGSGVAAPSAPGMYSGARTPTPTAQTARQAAWTAHCPANAATAAPTSAMTSSVGVCPASRTTNRFSMLTAEASRPNAPDSPQTAAKTPAVRRAVR